MKMEENRINVKVRCEYCGHRHVCRYSEAYHNYISDLENRILEVQKTAELNVGSIVSVDVVCSKYFNNTKERMREVF